MSERIIYDNKFLGTTPNIGSHSGSITRASNLIGNKISNAKFLNDQQQIFNP